MGINALRRSRTVAVVSGAAVLVTLGGVGGAAASRLITSADIKDQTIQSVDIAAGGVGTSEIRDDNVGMHDLTPWVRSQVAKAGTPGPRGPRGATGATGATGAPGAAGAAGQTGSRGPAGSPGTNGTNGTSAFNKLPEGKTVYGVIGSVGETAGNGSSHEALASLPMPSPVYLYDNDLKINDLGVAIASADVDNVNCSGDPYNPTAEPGYICIYPTSVTNATGVTASMVGGFTGFKLSWSDVSSQTNITGVEAVWAFTAPNWDSGCQTPTMRSAARARVGAAAPSLVHTAC